MLGKKITGVPTTAVAIKTEVKPDATLVSDLGVFGKIRVNRALKAAKTEAAVEHAQNVVAAAAHLADTALKSRATATEASLIATQAPVIGAVLSELVTQGGQVTLHMSALGAEGMFNSIGLRRALMDGIETRRAAGDLTDEEAAGARTYVDLQAQRNCARLDRYTEAALDTVDALVMRATDHIKNKSK